MEVTQKPSKEMGWKESKNKGIEVEESPVWSE